MALLEISGLVKRFGPRTVLDGIDLAVAEHEVVCLIGPSGCGKSTLLRCLNGLEPIQDGEVRLAGERVSGPGIDVDWLRRNVGIVFQSYNLFPHMSALDNIALAPRKVLRLPRATARAEAMRLLEKVGLADKAHERPDHLSGGQSQRVAIARALAMKPRVLLLDEVTSALDPELVGEVLGLVHALREEGMTIVMATHEMGFAREAASKVCFLDAGRIREEGPPQQIFAEPRDPRARAFLQRIIGANRL